MASLHGERNKMEKHATKLAVNTLRTGDADLRF